MTTGECGKKIESVTISKTNNDNNWKRVKKTTSRSHVENAIYRRCKHNRLTPCNFCDILSFIRFVLRTYICARLHTRRKWQQTIYFVTCTCEESLRFCLITVFEKSNSDVWKKIDVLLLKETKKTKSIWICDWHRATQKRPATGSTLRFAVIILFVLISLRKTFIVFFYLFQMDEAGECYIGRRFIDCSISPCHIARQMFVPN